MANEKKVVPVSNDVIYRGVGERKGKGYYNKGGGGKKKAKTKQRLRMPPQGGWRGGAPDSNGIKLTETYGSVSPMRRSECHRKGKVVM